MISYYDILYIITAAAAAAKGLGAGGDGRGRHGGHLVRGAARLRPQQRVEVATRGGSGSSSSYGGVEVGGRAAGARGGARDPLRGLRQRKGIVGKGLLLQRRQGRGVAGGEGKRMPRGQGRSWVPTVISREPPEIWGHSEHNILPVQKQHMSCISLV